MHQLVERFRLPVPAWFDDWFPAIATTVSIAIVTVAMVGGWPDFDVPPGSVTADGFIVVIETDEDAAGEVTEIRVRYGFVAPNGDYIFNIVAVGAGGALPGYGWEHLSNSEPIKVAYYPLQPEASTPYRAFPFWALGSWATVIGSIVLSLAVWFRRTWFSTERALTAAAAERQ